MSSLFITKGTQEMFDEVFSSNEEIRRKQRLLNAESCDYKGDYRPQSETDEAERAGE